MTRHRSILLLATTCLVASCATDPGDHRSAAERLTAAVFGAAAAPVSVVVDTVAGPALDEAEDVANRIHAYRASRKERRDARALCLADPERFTVACAIAFPTFSAAPDADQGEAPSEPRGAVPPNPSPHGRDATPPTPAAAPTGLRWERMAPPRPAEPEPDTMLADSVRAHEGLRLEPYQDKGGVWHVCYGRSLPAPPLRPRYTLAECEALLAQDLARGQRVAERVVGARAWADLDQVRRDVLAELGMATNLPSFVDMLDAVRHGDFAAAAAELVDSHWARWVGGDRPKVLAERLRTGVTTTE